MINKFEIHISRLIVLVILLATYIAVIMPLNPGMPSGGIEGSWILGMNQAVTQGMTFGKDIIFTFGPYASVYTKSYQPETDGLMLGASLFITIVLFTTTVTLSRRSPLWTILAFSIIFASIPFSPDAIFFFYPFLVALIIYQHDSTLCSPSSVGMKRTANYFILLVFAPFGLLPLIKSSILFACLPTICLSTIIFLIRRQWVSATLAFASPMLSMVIFWVGSGQSAANLPHYLSSMSPIISGYTDAMALSGNPSDLIYFTIPALSIIYVVAFAKSSVIRRLYLLGILLPLLLLSFKAGFVRQDAHIIRSFVTLVLISTSLTFVLKWKAAALPTLVSLFALFFAAKGATGEFTPGKNLSTTFAQGLRGVSLRLTQPDLLQKQYNAEMHKIRLEGGLPVLPGTTDIYPTEQAYLIASGNLWSPRPIIQSYSAYTRQLEQINTSHVSQPGAPDNIFFSIDPLDQRYPALEDGSTWPVLLFKYKPRALTHNYLILQKTLPELNTPPSATISKGVFKLGEEVSLSVPINKIVTAKIYVTKTLFGRLISALYKPTSLWITVELEDGHREKYRFIPGFAGSEFILSPLVRNSMEFAKLYVNDSPSKSDSIRSMVISTIEPRLNVWHDTYTLELHELPYPSPTKWSTFLSLEALVDLSGVHRAADAGRCEGDITVLNGRAPNNDHNEAGSLLQIRGWLANSVADGIVPASVYVDLTDSSGKHYYIKTRRTVRQDVKDYFKKPDLGDVGFEAAADISTLPARKYKLGLAYIGGGSLRGCPQFSFPLNISGQ